MVFDPKPDLLEEALSEPVTLNSHHRDIVDFLQIRIDPITRLQIVKDALGEGKLTTGEYDGIALTLGNSYPNSRYGREIAIELDLEVPAIARCLWDLVHVGVLSAKFITSINYDGTPGTISGSMFALSTIGLNLEDYPEINFDEEPIEPPELSGRQVSWLHINSSYLDYPEGTSK